MAPEQISGKPVDARCDVYGFACVVYECLAGHPPFRRDDDMALLWAHQYDEPPPVTEARPDLAAAVDTVFADALAKSPDRRQDSCLAFVAELRAAVAGGTGAGHAPTEVDLRVAGARAEPADAGEPRGRAAVQPSKGSRGRATAEPSPKESAGRVTAEPSRESGRYEPNPPPRWAEPVFRR